MKLKRTMTIRMKTNVVVSSSRERNSVRSSLPSSTPVLESRLIQAPANVRIERNVAPVRVSAAIEPASSRMARVPAKKFPIRRARLIRMVRPESRKRRSRLRKPSDALGIETCSRFVKQKDGRFVQQGAGNSHALAHPPRERADQRIRRSDKTNFLQQRFNAVFRVASFLGDAQKAKDFLPRSARHRPSWHERRIPDELQALRPHACPA